MSSWYEQQPEYKEKMAELERQAQKKRKKAKQKKIEEALVSKEILLTTETQQKLDHQIQEAFIQLENLNHTILEKKEILKALEIDIINAVERLKTVKFELEQNYNWQLLMDKLDKLKKSKSQPQPQ